MESLLVVPLGLVLLAHGLERRGRTIVAHAVVAVRSGPLEGPLALETFDLATTVDNVADDGRENDKLREAKEN